MEKSVCISKSFLGSNGVLRWVEPLISGNPTSPRLSGKSQVRSGANEDDVDLQEMQQLDLLETWFGSEV